MFDRALQIFILTVSFWYFGKGTVLEASYLPFIIGIIGLFIVAIREKAVRQVRLIYPSLFLIYCVLNFILTNSKQTSIPVLTSIFFGIFLLYLVVNYASDYKRFIDTIKIVALINIIFVILQLLKISPILNSTGNGSVWSISGFYERSSSLSAFILLAMPFFLPLGIALFVIPNYTGMVVGLSLLANYFNRLLIPAILVIISLVIIINKDGIKGKYLSRLPVLSEAFRSVLNESPYFGYGLGSFQRSELAKKYTWDTELKSDPIEWLYWAGISGWIFLWLWIRSIIRIIRRSWRNNEVQAIALAIIGFSLMGITQGVFQNVKLLSIFLPLLAWLYIKTDKEVYVL